MTPADKLALRIDDYLKLGGLFNPEMMKPEAVRDLLIDCRSELQRAQEAEMSNTMPPELEALYKLHKSMEIDGLRSQCAELWKLLENLHLWLRRTELQRAQRLTDRPLGEWEHRCELCGEIWVGVHKCNALLSAPTPAEKVHETIGYETDYMRGRREMREEIASGDAPTPAEPSIGVSYGPISEMQKEYIYRGELPLAEQTQRKWREIMDDAMRHIKRAIVDLQVVERDWKMDADALEAVVPNPHDPDWRDPEHPPE